MDAKRWLGVCVALTVALGTAPASAASLSAVRLRPAGLSDVTAAPSKASAAARAKQPTIVAGRGRTVRAFPEYVEGVVLVRFDPYRASGAAGRAKVHERAGGRKHRKLGRVPGLEVVELEKGVSVEEAIRAYSKSPGVKYAQPNHIVRPATAVMPDDPYFPTQWGLNNTGQSGGLADKDVDAPEAWRVETGSVDVTVAVIDTGVDYTHPDLADNMWSNAVEVGGVDGVDDDGNGYVDDKRGIDTESGDSDPMDEDGHGTHVAGTIGAVSDNATGVAGMCWNVNLLAVRAIGTSGSDAATIEAIDYATAMGADIVNCSWGGGGTGNGDAVYDAIAASPALFVCAAGNEYDNADYVPFYPAAYSLANIISVAATDDRDAKADFSNWGSRSVDLGAPGVEITSTIPGDKWTDVFDDPFPDTALTGWDTGDYKHKAWEATGTRFWTSPFSAANTFYADDEESVLHRPAPFALTTYPAYRLAYRIWADLEGGYDFLYSTVSTDGVHFNILSSYSGYSGGWVEEEDDLGAYVGTPAAYPGFWLESDPTGSGAQGYEGVYLDDVRLRGYTGVPVYGRAYTSVDYSGTSMATPHVTGAAALLKSYDQSLTVAQLKSYVLGGVDAVSGLSGLVLTGGRLNAYASLLDLAPPERIGGADRYEVAANMAAKGWDGGNGSWPDVSDVVIACGETGKEADPLCSSGLAGALDAPILLTRTTSLPYVTRRTLGYIRSRNPGVKVWVVGGPASVPSARITDIKAITHGAVERIGGADRYEVSARLASKMVSRLGTAAIPGALVVCAEDPAAFYDATAVSTAAFRSHLPMLAVRKAYEPSAIKAVRTGALAGEPTYVVNSPSYVYPTVMSRMGAAERFATTTDRYLSATEIMDAVTGTHSWVSTAGLGAASKLSDSLTGGTFMGKRDGAFLYTDTGSDLQWRTAAAVSAHRASITDAWVFGGTASIKTGAKRDFAERLLP